MTLRRLLTHILPLILWLAVIFTLSTGTGSASHTNSALDHFLARFFPAFFHHLTWPQLDALHYYLRKAAHVTEYAVLGLLVVRACRPVAAGVSPKTLLIAWLFCTLNAATDEIHQVFVSGRTPKVTDVMLDSFGAALGIALIRAVRLHRRLTAGTTVSVPS